MARRGTLSIVPDLHAQGIALAGRVDGYLSPLAAFGEAVLERILDEGLKNEGGQVGPPHLFGRFDGGAEPVFEAHLLDLQVGT